VHDFDIFRKKELNILSFYVLLARNSNVCALCILTVFQ